MSVNLLNELKLKAETSAYRPRRRSVLAKTKTGVSRPTKTKTTGPNPKTTSL